MEFVKLFLKPKQTYSLVGNLFQDHLLVVLPLTKFKNAMQFLLF